MSETIEAMKRTMLIKQYRAQAESAKLRGPGYSPCISADELLALLDMLAAAVTELSQQWVACVDRLPSDETPVLIYRNGYIRLGELRWERPNFEDNYDAFRYWDDPSDDGKDWEFSSVTHWSELPAPPKL